MKCVRALVLDLDRTLLRSDRTISLYTQQTLDRCRQKGIALMIATARPPRTIEQYVDIIRPDAVIAMNGAQVTVRGSEVVSLTLGYEAVRGLVEAVERTMPGRRWSVETTEGFFAGFDTSEIWEGPSAPQVTPDTLPAAPAYKVIIDFTEPGDADAVRALLPEEACLEIADGVLGMIMPRGADKVSGIRAALAALEIPIEQAAAFGDDRVDIGILKACGFGVAVANALDEVKAAADYVTASNDEDGVALWLEEHADL